MTQLTQPASAPRARVCDDDRMEIRFLADTAYIAEVCEPVTIPIERTVQGKTVYEPTGYTPVHLLRRATRAEIDEWRWGK